MFTSRNSRLLLACIIVFCLLSLPATVWLVQEGKSVLQRGERMSVQFEGQPEPVTITFVSGVPTLDSNSAFVILVDGVATTVTADQAFPVTKGNQKVELTVTPTRWLGPYVKVTILGPEGTATLSKVD